MRSRLNELHRVFQKSDTHFNFAITSVNVQPYLAKHIAANINVIFDLLMLVVHQQP